MTGFWVGLAAGVFIGAFAVDAFWRPLYNETVDLYTKMWMRDPGN